MTRTGLPSASFYEILIRVPPLFLEKMADVSSLLQQVLDRLGKIERKIGVASSSSDGPERNPLAAAFESEIVAGPGAALIAAARAIDGNDGEQLAKSFEAQFASALRVLDMAGACKKPTPEVRSSLVARRARRGGRRRGGGQLGAPPRRPPPRVRVSAFD